MLSAYDILENPSAWTDLGKERVIPTPGRTFINLWTPKVVTQRLFMRTASIVGGEPVERLFVWYGRYGQHAVIEAADETDFYKC